MPLFFPFNKVLLYRDDHEIFVNIFGFYDIFLERYPEISKETFYLAFLCFYVISFTKDI